MVLKILNRYIFWIIVLAAIVATGKLNSNFLSIMLHKASTVIVAYITAETIWLLGYKMIFGSIEDKLNNADGSRTLMPTAVFRGILYAAIILGFSIGI